MKKLLTICTMLAVFVGLVVIAAPTVKAPQAPAAPQTVSTAASSAPVVDNEKQVAAEVYARWLATGTATASEKELMSRHYFTNEGEGSNPLDAQGGPDPFGYRYVDNVAPDTEPYVWDELCNDPTASVGPSGDDASMLIQFGMTFPYYGMSYTNGYISTNGVLSFSGSNTAWGNTCISAANTNYAIYIYWDDMIATAGTPGTCTNGVIYYKNMGGYFLIEYHVLDPFSGTGLTSVQCRLFPDGTVKIAWHATEYTHSSVSATVALEAPGTNGLQYICNAAGIAAGRAVRFYLAAPAVGRCCYGDPCNPTCIDQQTGAQCAALGGTWTADITCGTPCPVPQPGEICCNALPLTVPGVVSGNTCGFVNNYDVTPCQYTGPGGKDVVYTYTPIQTELVSLNLCGGTTNYDTRLYVYAGQCVNPPVACNDDACTAPNYPSPYVSRLDCIELIGGTTYYVVVDGYSSYDCGDYTLEATLCTPCIVECPPYGIPEGEPCPNVPDNFNGGCNSTPNVFSPIACGMTVCGTSNAAGGTRDTDWYELVLTQPMTVTVTATAEFNLLVGTLNSPCPQTSFRQYATALACDVATVVDLMVAPGIYYVFVAQGSFADLACSDYVLTVTCEPYTPPPCHDFTLFAPGTLSGNTTGAGDNCTLNAGAEQMVEVHIPYTGMWIFDLCNPGTMYDTWLDLYDGCCGTLIASNDDYCGLVSRLDHIPLEAGTYYLAVEGYSTSTGPWELDVYACRQRVDFDPTIVPQSICVHMDNSMHTDFVIGGAPGTPPLDPSMPPIVTVVPGCDPAYTDCNDPECPPYPGMIEIVWVYVADSVIYCDCGYPGCNCAPIIIQGGWYAVIMNMDHMHGCVCVTLEGFLAAELQSFTATPRDGEVELAWATASEVNNLRFDIVRNDATVAQVEATNNAAGGTYSWTDRNVTNGTVYRYTLVGVDVNGGRTELATQSATPSFGSAIITEYALHQNYPNPFNPETQVTYDLVDNGFVSLKVYNLMGQEVSVLANGMKDAGRHTVSFDASGLPSGIYIYTLKANGFTAQKKMVLMK